MVLKLYALQASPPCRAVQLLLDILSQKHDYVEVDVVRGETRTDKFKKLNPQHQIPVLQDGDVVVCESKAIMLYLCQNYAKSDHLYPKELSARAKVDMRLFFDHGTFYPAVADVAFPVIFGGQDTVPQDKVDQLQQVLKWVSDMVMHGFCAGTKSMSIADIAFMATYSTVKACRVVDMSRYHFIEAWFNRCKQQVPHYQQVCGEGAQYFGDFYSAKLKENARKLLPLERHHF